MDRGQSKLALIPPNQRQAYLRSLAEKQKVDAGVVIPGAKPPRRRKAGTPRKCNNVACDKIVTKRNFCYKCQKRKERGRVLETQLPSAKQGFSKAAASVTTSLGPEATFYHDEAQAAETRSSVHVGVVAEPVPDAMVGEATEISAPTAYNPHRTAWAAPSEWNMPPPPKRGGGGTGGMLPSIASLPMPSIQPVQHPAPGQDDAAMEELYSHALSLTNGRVGDAVAIIQRLASKVAPTGHQKTAEPRLVYFPAQNQQHVMAAPQHHIMAAPQQSFAPNSRMGLPSLASMAPMQNSALSRPGQPRQAYSTVWSAPHTNSA